MNKIINQLIAIYYKLKLGIKSKNGAVGIIVSHTDDKKKKEFDAKLEKLAHAVKPCHKSILEVEQYITKKYNAKKVDISDGQVRMFKVNTILNFYPNLLQTQDIKLCEKPKRKEFQRWSENNDKRFKEALNYPIEKLNLDISCYEFDYMLKTGEKVKFSIIMDKTTEQCSLSSGSEGTLSEEQQKEIHKIHQDIDIYKGVTQEDIDNRTPRFLGYAMNFMDN